MLTILLDGSTTGTGSAVTINTPEDGAAAYVSGLTSETLDIEYRPTTSDTWVTILSSVISDDGVSSIHPLPDGQYRAVMSGSSETPVVRLIA